MTSYKTSLGSFNLVKLLTLLCLNINLVICGGVDDESLENALEAIERRQRDLRIRENYGQPENIGYGFQKNLGLFEPGPARLLGVTRTGDQYDDQDGLFGDNTSVKRMKSSFRERNDILEPRADANYDYLEAVRTLWDRYQQRQHQRQAAPIDLEQLTEQELAELFSAVQVDNDESNALPVIPRGSRSYHPYRGYSKRSPSFGQGLYGKRQQQLAQVDPQNDAFLYSLKWVNPANNREGIEGLRAAEPWADDRDGDIAAILAQPRYSDAESWLSAPESYRVRDEKRSPVKRNADAPVQKTNTSEEVKGIFSSETKKTAVLKGDKKKPNVITKKSSGESIKKAYQDKKIVRRAEPSQPGEIQELFRMQKKSVDWSKHWGVNKRMYVNPFDTRVFNSKRNLKDNLEVVENKISGVEDRILNDAVLFTGAHGDEGLDGIREDVMRRLEAAYSLEKMRAALEEFKNSVNTATDNPQVSTLNDKTGSVTDLPFAGEYTKSKRFPTVDENIASKAGMESDFLNWDHQASNPNDGPECPLLEMLVDNCMRMEESLGKFAELLTPACTLHQICYTCGPEFGFSRATACDLMFLNEAHHLCQEKPECVGGAREAVSALREMHERELEQHERIQPIGGGGVCRANPCVADHFLTSPSGVVTLNV